RDVSTSRSRLRPLIQARDDETTGSELRQELVSLALLFEGLAEEGPRVTLVELVSQSTGRAIRRDFVMLDALGGGDECNVLDLARSVGADDLGDFADEPLHGL